MKKHEQPFTWQRFWKNFNLAFEPFIKVGVVIVGIFLLWNLSKSKVAIENPQSIITFAAGIIAILIPLIKKPTKQ